MFNANNLFKHAQPCQSVTGLNQSEIEDLLPTFRDCLIQCHYEQRLRGERVRPLGGGRKGAMPTDLDNLYSSSSTSRFTQPTTSWPSLATESEASVTAASRCCCPCLKKALGRSHSLPERKINSVDDFLEKFPGIKDVFIDGTEWPTRKVKDPGKPKKLYSGKMKMTTRKTILATDESKRILIMTPTKSGRRHDKRLAEKTSLVENVPPEVASWAKTGFQGIQHVHPYLCMPKKSPKKHPLIED